MPFIQINILKGRSPEKKERLIHEITDKVSEVLEAPVAKCSRDDSGIAARALGNCRRICEKREMRDPNDKSTKRSKRSRSLYKWKICGLK